jgi:pantothenate kinase
VTAPGTGTGTGGAHPGLRLRVSDRGDADDRVALAARITELLARADNGRVVLGMAGEPGAGKSTLASAVAAVLDVPTTVVPLDGFHLADVELVRQGLLRRKGAPETFDPWGYAALLRRLRSRPDHSVYAPGFERDLEQPLAGAIVVAPEVELVLTEGNYLLLDRPEWRAGREQLDEVWYVDVDPVVRRDQLVRRHVRFGKSQDDAERWVAEVDDANAVLVAASRPLADLVVEVIPRAAPPRTT